LLTVTLPESIDPDSIAAELTNGVLHVTVSKKPEAQPKRIEIK
jgi:HSP20 family protein